MVEAYPVRRYLIATDPWTQATRRRENPSVEDRQKQAAKELEARKDAANAPKPKTPVERPFLAQKPFWMG